MQILTNRRKFTCTACAPVRIRAPVNKKTSRNMNNTAPGCFVTMKCIHDSEDESITGSVQSPEALNVLDLLVHLEAKKKYCLKTSLLWNPTAAPRKDVAIPIQRNTKKSHLFRCKKKYIFSNSLCPSL